MKVGVTGHQNRQGVDWRWVDDQLAANLGSIDPPFSGYSSLAEGADQRFAKAVLEAGGELHAVIPMDGYEDHFQSAEALSGYQWLIERSQEIRLRSQAPPDQAFLAAGAWIVSHVDRLIAVWDELPAEGLGGTADVVELARERGIAINIINPVDRSLRRIPACR